MNKQACLSVVVLETDLARLDPEIDAVDFQPSKIERIFVWLEAAVRVALGVLKTSKRVDILKKSLGSDISVRLALKECKYNGFAQLRTWILNK